MPIINPFPITPGVASACWATRVVLTPDNLSAEVYPWDGQYLIYSHGVLRNVQVREAASIAGVFAEVGRLVGCDPNAVRCVTVLAPMPDQPISAICIYETGPAVPTEIDNEIRDIAPTAVYHIPDLFTALSEDSKLAVAYEAVINEISAEVK